MDTNFIVSFLSQHRDIEDEILTSVQGRLRIIVLDLVVLELERLARKASSNVRSWASVSLDHIRRKNYSIATHRPGPADVDAALISFAVAETIPTYVATIDRELRTALRSLGVPTLSPKKRHGLIVEGRASSDLNKGQKGKSL